MESCSMVELSHNGHEQTDGRTEAEPGGGLHLEAGPSGLWFIL